MLQFLVIGIVHTGMLIFNMIFVTVILLLLSKGYKKLLRRGKQPLVAKAKENPFASPTLGRNKMVCIFLLFLFITGNCFCVSFLKSCQTCHAWWVKLQSFVAHWLQSGPISKLTGYTMATQSDTAEHL